MALRWVRTIDESPHMFSSGRHPDAIEDWLLYSGGCLVGRLSREGGARQDLAWRLTRGDAVGAPVAKRGAVASIAQGKEQLAAAYRAWAAWAGIDRDAGAAPLRWQPSDRSEACELASSGGLKIGFVEIGRYAEGTGWVRRPHWTLTALTAPDDARFPRAGWADRIDAAKACLTEAWSGYLVWAELPPIAAGPGPSARSRRASPASQAKCSAEPT